MAVQRAPGGGDDLVHAGDAPQLQVARVGRGHVGARDPLHRGVQIVERALGGLFQQLVFIGFDVVTGLLDDKVWRGANLVGENFLIINRCGRRIATMDSS